MLWSTNNSQKLGFSSIFVDLRWDKDFYEKDVEDGNFRWFELEKTKDFQKMELQ